MENRALTQVLFGIALMFFSLVFVLTVPQIFQGIPGTVQVSAAVALLTAAAGLLLAYRGYNETRVTPRS